PNRNWQPLASPFGPLLFLFLPPSAVLLSSAPVVCTGEHARIRSLHPDGRILGYFYNDPEPDGATGQLKILASASGWRLQPMKPGRPSRVPNPPKTIAK